MHEPADDNSLRSLSLCEAAERLRQGDVSAAEMTRASLAAIEDDTSNSFITVSAESAMEQARAADREIAAGKWRGPLHGIPIAIKDLVDVEGERTTAGSRVFADRVAGEDAPIVRRLRAAGAVIVGKTNLHEFAYGGSGLISAYGAVRNPLDGARIAGGSSSGSAAAVAARLCFAAIGTDTAGSIRLPAAYCCVVGFKPTFGLVSADGVVPLAESYDHVGPIARTVADTEVVLRAIADLPNEGGIDVKRVRVGVARRYFSAGLDDDYAAAFAAAVRQLASCCAEVHEVNLPVDEDRTVHRYEAWRFHRKHVARCPELYDPETLRRIRSGERVSAPEYEEKRRELERLRASAGESFRTVDVIVTPTVPIPPPTIAELLADPEQLRARELLMLRNTRPFNVLGVPAVSVPLPARRGWPAGLQIAAAPGSDAMLLKFAAALPPF